uniref:HEAT repeat domain-containing protein n=1 Tax=Steinernema glaseri TaxID=37863 RepID=A0A1I8ATE2_9BILA
MLPYPVIQRTLGGSVQRLGQRRSIAPPPNVEVTRRRSLDQLISSRPMRLLALALDRLHDSVAEKNLPLPQELRRTFRVFREDVAVFEAAFRSLLPGRRLRAHFVVFDARQRLDVAATVRSLKDVVSPSAYVALCGLNLMEKDFKEAPKPKTLLLDLLMHPRIHRGVSLYSAYLRRGRFGSNDATATLVFLAKSGFERLFELFLLEHFDQVHILDVLRRCSRNRTALRVVERLARKKGNALLGTTVDRSAILEELRRRPGLIAASADSDFVRRAVRHLMAAVGDWHLEKLDRWLGEYPADAAESLAYCRLRHE